MGRSKDLPVEPTYYRRHLIEMIISQLRLLRIGGRRVESEGMGMVYIIDDDESVLDAMELLMQSAGIDAATFSSAVDFLQKVTPSITDCIVMDLCMPGLHGFEMLKILSDRGVTVPVIVLTALDEAESRERARQMGVKAFFRKPVDDQALIDMIHWSLGSRETAEG